MAEISFSCDAHLVLVILLFYGLLKRNVIPAKNLWIGNNPLLLGITMDVMSMSRPVLTNEFPASETEAFPVSVRSTMLFLSELDMLLFNMTSEVPGAHGL